MARFSRATPPRGIADLNGRVVLVTGAAQGIGRALALALWNKGAHLALVDLRKDDLFALERELLESATGQRVSKHIGDVADRQWMRQLAADVIQCHGALHVLINNAGVAYEGAFLETSLDDWDRIVAVNLIGVIHGCHFFLPHLARVDRAHIVNISSLLGIVAMPGQSAYSATKFAVRGFSEALQEELRTTSVGLTVVHPGAVATGIMRRARGDDPELLRRIDEWYERKAMRPERVATRIVRGIEKGTPRLMIAPDAVFADLLKRAMPVAGNRIFVDAGIRMLGVEDMRATRSRQWEEMVVGGATQDRRGALEP